MERWIGKVAMVTGAGSGIGAAISVSLVQAGMKVIGVDRNYAALEELAESLSNARGFLSAMECDVTKDEELEAVFRTIDANYGGLDVCINNAGVNIAATLLDGQPKDWRKISDVNVVALCYCSKLATHSMLEKKVDNGHIINISSENAHKTKVVEVSHFYSATKHAVKFITEGLRQEMIEKKHKIRVTAISPAPTSTNFMKSAYKGQEDKLEDLEQRGTILRMNPENVAKTVLYILSLPPNVEVNDIILRSFGQP